MQKNNHLSVTESLVYGIRSVFNNLKFFALLMLAFIGLLFALLIGAGILGAVGLVFSLFTLSVSIFLF